MGQFQLKPSFAGGELTPALYGRTDLQKYDVGAAKLENAIVLRYGGVSRRPGFKHIEQTKSNNKARLIPFSYNAEQNYVLEFTDKKVRIYQNGEIVKIDNTIVEVDTPYTEAELPQIKYAQSADMLFLTHPNHHPAAITRTLEGWEWAELKIENGPFDDANATDITITPDRKTTTMVTAYKNVGQATAPFFSAGRTYASSDLTVTKTGYFVCEIGGLAPSTQFIPVKNTDFKKRPLKDIWLRLDVYYTAPAFVNSELYSGAIAVCFDDKPQKIGIVANNVRYFNSSGIYIEGGFNSENYIGQYDAEAAPDNYSPYVSQNTMTKVVLHAGTNGVWVYHNDNLVYSQAIHQGDVIKGFYIGSGLRRYSNIIIADFDCSNLTLEDGDIDIPDGSAMLTASGPLFTQDMVGQLVRLGHTVPAEYKKGVPGTDDLTVSCVPGASVYVESFGFWEGDFSVYKDDVISNWIMLKEQSGNRSQNYNMTFQNDDVEIRSYKVDSSNFDNSVHGAEDPDQRGYVTIQSFSNDYDGIVRILSVTDSTHAKAEIYKPLASTDPTLDWSFQAWSIGNGYPQAVGFFEDRMVYAGSPKHPQTYWTSKTGSYLDFGTSYPGKDDDAITGTLATGQMNGIKAIVSFDEMVMLTTGGEYRVSGGGSNFTPTTQQAKAQEYRGITDVPPVIIGGRILYVQRGGSIIRDLAYSYDVDKYTGGEISILASHLFDGHEIVSMTYQQAPESVLWCVRSDGVMVAMTYIHEQDVYAWHRHTTQGQFIDVCSIPGDKEDELWAVVKRGNNYYVEQMMKQEDNVYVDSAAIYDGAATSTVTGLSWLASESVQVVGDGNKLTDEEISAGGQLDVDNEFTHIVTGLAYDTNVVTLPVEINGQDGTWGSRKKRVQRMCVMFKDTLGGRFGFDGKALDEIKWRSTEAYNEAVSAYTGKKHITLPQANYEDTIMLQIKQPDPFPMTILSIIPEILPGG